ERLSRKAIEIDPYDAEGHVSLGDKLVWWGDLVQGAVEVERALSSIRVRPTSWRFPPGPCTILAGLNKARRYATRLTVSIPRRRHFIQRFATGTIFLPSGTESRPRRRSVLTHGSVPTS